MLVDVGAVTANGDLGIDRDGRCTLNGQRITPDTADDALPPGEAGSRLDLDDMILTMAHCDETDPDERAA